MLRAFFKNFVAKSQVTLKKNYAEVCGNFQVAKVSKNEKSGSSFPHNLINFEWVIKKLYFIMPVSQKLDDMYLVSGFLHLGKESVGMLSVESNSLILNDYKFIEKLSLSDDYFLLTEQRRVLSLLYFMSTFVFNANVNKNTVHDLITSRFLSDRYYSLYNENPVMRYTLEESYQHFERLTSPWEVFNYNPLVLSTPFLVIQKSSETLKGVNIKLKDPVSGYISIVIVKEINNTYSYKINKHFDAITENFKDFMRITVNPKTNIRRGDYQQSHFYSSLKNTVNFDEIINEISMFTIKNFHSDYDKDKPFTLQDKQLYDMIRY